MRGQYGSGYIGQWEKVYEPLCAVCTEFVIFFRLVNTNLLCVTSTTIFQPLYTRDMDNEHESTLELSQLASSLDISNLTMTSNGMLVTSWEQEQYGFQTVLPIWLNMTGNTISTLTSNFFFVAFSLVVVVEAMPIYKRFIHSGDRSIQEQTECTYVYSFIRSRAQFTY